MENLTGSIDVQKVVDMLYPKACKIDKDTLLKFLNTIPAKSITGDGIEWELTKKGAKLSIAITRQDTIETITWELKANKK